MLDALIAQIIALAAFFAFPAFQYLLLRLQCRRDGTAELWYLPDYGFRLVIRNLPGKKTLTSIQYRIFLRSEIPASEGASVKTFSDTPLLDHTDFFLFPETDQILL